MRENIPLLIAKKVMIFLVSVWLLSLAVFCMARLAPGDPLSAYYGERVEKMSVAEKAEARTKLGLDEPLLEQYGVWLKNALHGDFGISYKYKQPVMEVIVQRAGNTLLLGGVGFVLTFLGALGLGLLCAWYEDRWVDKMLCRLGTVMSCIPEFWLSMILILIFCVALRWLPSSGAYAIGHADDVGDRIVHLILPMAVVLAGHLWYYAYMVRSRLLEEVRSDYVLMGRATGLSRRRLLLRHCLPNSLPAYFSLMAISVPHVLGGTYIVETVFSYPGLGALSFESARYADYNLLMVLCILTGALVILCSGVEVHYGAAAGAELTIEGFIRSYGSVASLLAALVLCCFAFSTILGWGLYGLRCVEYLFGSRAGKPFLIVYSLVAILGATLELELIWNVADTFNALMSIPNLIAVALLSPVVVELIQQEWPARRAK